MTKELKRCSHTSTWTIGRTWHAGSAFTCKCAYMQEMPLNSGSALTFRKCSHIQEVYLQYRKCTHSAGTDPVTAHPPAIANSFWSVHNWFTISFTPSPGCFHNVLCNKCTCVCCVCACCVCGCCMRACCVRTCCMCVCRVCMLYVWTLHACMLCVHVVCMCACCVCILCVWMLHVCKLCVHVVCMCASCVYMLYACVYVVCTCCMHVCMLCVHVVCMCASMRTCMCPVLYYTPAWRVPL